MINGAIGHLLPQTPADVKKVSEQLGYNNLPIFSQNAYTLYKGEGCTDCTDGFKGRIGIYEIFEMTESMERLLLTTNTTSTAIQQQAQKEGMLTMQQDGIIKALTGVTTIEEVSRVSADL
jgi:type IV pilus assembly protein PilB